MQVNYVDHLWIKVNGHTVYVGPKVGSSIEAVPIPHAPLGYIGSVKYGKDEWACDLTTKCRLSGKGWHQSTHCVKAPAFNLNLSTDLKPYLKTGLNEIWMRVVVGKLGYGWMKIIAKQKCCLNWQDQWSEQCQIR